jgi:hypothetical protein
MSSSYVRTQLKTFITANSPAENQADMSGGYEDIQVFLGDKGIAMTDPWLGLQFIPNDEVPITLPATNTSGKYRETGAVYIHIVDVAKPNVSDSILTRGETLRDLLRGRRLGEVKVESITPLNFELGATLNFDGGFVAASFILSYQYDRDL